MSQRVYINLKSNGLPGNHMEALGIPKELIGFSSLL
jgi:hypothetical protein